MGARYHKELDVWKAAMQFAADIYRATEKLPKHELYGLVSQLRRAAVSVASNISEGAARQSKKEFIQFLYCSLGSSVEIETQLELTGMLGFLSESELQPLFELRERIAQMLYGLIRKLKS